MGQEWVCCAPGRAGLFSSRPNLPLPASPFPAFFADNPESKPPCAAPQKCMNFHLIEPKL